MYSIEIFFKIVGSRTFLDIHILLAHNCEYLAVFSSCEEFEISAIQINKNTVSQYGQKADFDPLFYIIDNKMFRSFKLSIQTKLFFTCYVELCRRLKFKCSSYLAYSWVTVLSSFSFIYLKFIKMFQTPVCVCILLVPPTCTKFNCNALGGIQSLIRIIRVHRSNLTQIKGCADSLQLFFC